MGILSRLSIKINFEFALSINLLALYDHQPQCSFMIALLIVKVCAGNYFFNIVTINE